MFDWQPSSVFSEEPNQLREFTGNNIQLKGGHKSQCPKIHYQLRPDAIVDQAIADEFKLPDQHHVIESLDAPVFWLSPNEWLLISPPKLLPETHDITTTLTDQLEVIELSGSGAMALLSEGVGIDLSMDQFVVGAYSHTRLAGFSVLLFKTSVQPTYELYVDRSLAWKLWQWLGGNGSTQYPCFIKY